MVELQLQPLEAKLAKDTYVSIRIGDAQKLSRANQSRQFKFSANNVGDRKFAKLEVFKRVGGCSLGITQNSDQELNVTLDDNSTIGFKASFKDIGNTVQSTKIDTGDSNTKVQAAKAYLDKHNLEMRLSDAMQTVLRERPDDPAAFIAEKLSKSAEMVKYVPKVPATEAPGAPPVPKKSPELAEKTPAKSVPETAAKSVPEMAAKSVPAPSGPAAKVLTGGAFKEYYAGNMKQMKPTAFEGIYASFPTRAGAPPTKELTQQKPSAPAKASMSLTECSALVAGASTSEIEAALVGLSATDRARLGKIFSSITSKAKSDEPKTLSEYVALAGSANNSEVKAALSAMTENDLKRLSALLSPPAQEKTLNEIVAVAMDVLTIEDAAVVLASFSEDVKKKLSNALIELSPLNDIAALVTSATLADIETSLASLSAGAKQKLKDALILTF